MQKIVIDFEGKKSVLETEKDGNSFTLCRLLDNETGYQNPLPTGFELGEQRDGSGTFLALDSRPRGIRNIDFKMRNKMVKIPSKFCSRLRAGQEVAFSVDAQGRLIITPIEQIHAPLQETFGM